MLFELRDVSFVYGDGTPGLDGISGTIRTGDRLAILGANGCGKSTLLRALNGLVEPTAGSILYKGMRLCENSLKDPFNLATFRSQVGFVFQDADAQLFNATVEEEVGFGPGQLGLDQKDVQERVAEILNFLGIAYLSDRAPFRLSGGEKRKVALASVLAMNPEVILLDEPFVGLDPRSQSWLVRTLNQLNNAGKTTIVATHSLGTLADIADTAMVLSEDHRLLATASITDLQRDSSLLQAANLLLEPERVGLAR